MSRWYGFVVVCVSSLLALVGAVVLLVHGLLFFAVSVGVLGLLLGWAAIDNRFVYHSHRAQQVVEDRDDLNGVLRG